jgi:DNA repair exonuclease SbcCD ATPase subunit
LRDLSAQLEAKPKISIASIVPPEIFRGPEFESPLSSQLDKIANNSSLQPGSKIKNAYKFISAVYTAKLDDSAKQLQKAFADAQQIRDIVNQFFIDLSIGITGRALNFDDIVFNNAGPELLDSILTLRSTNEVTIRDCEAYRQAIDRLHSSFNPPDLTDPLSKIHVIQKYLDELTAKSLARSRKLRLLKSSLSNLQKAASAASAKITSLETDLAVKSEEFDQTLSELRGTIRSLKAENESLSDRLSHEQSDRAEEVAVLSGERESAVTSILNEHRKTEAQLRHDIQISQQNLETLNREYQDSELQLSRFRKLLQSQRTITKRLESELAELQQSVVEKETAARERFEADKAQLTESFETAISELQAQRERHLESLQKVRATLSDRETKLTQSRAGTTHLNREKQRTEEALKNLMEQTERERKLAETAARARTLALDTEYRERIDALKEKFDAEKRMLFTLVAETFSAFFNLSEPIDERSLRWGLESAKLEMARLTAAEQEIRRLLGVVEGQTAQDAVAQLILATE